VFEPHADFLQRCLQHVEEQRRLRHDNPRIVFRTWKKEMGLATSVELERLCRLAHVSRAGYYRWQSAPPAIYGNLDLRDEIQRIALEFPSYGWPRITPELRRRG
jgi:hypothetical protein